MDYSSLRNQALIVAGAAVVLLAAMLLLVNPSGMEFTVAGENVSCGAPLLSRNDSFAYRVSLPSAGFNATVAYLGLDRGRNCSLFRQESDANATLEACYSIAGGGVEYVTVMGRELPLEALAGEPPVLAFEPWMACAREGWSGAINYSSGLKPGAIRIADVSDVTEVRYSVNGSEEVSGRRALRVEVVRLRHPRGTGGGAVEVGRRTEWVDAEKKVLLKMVDGASGLSVELAGAPFPLENETGD